MSSYGTMLLSKVIDENDVQALSKFDVNSDQFKVETDKRAFKFILEYAEQNEGNAPSYATVIENIPDFFYITDVTDNYEWLTRKLRNDAGQTDFVSLVQTDLQQMFDNYKNDVPTLIDKLTEKLDNIKMRTEVRINTGKNLKKDTGLFLEEYDRRKDGKSFKTWKSKFPNIGDYTSGNMYVGYAKSGRGKSIIFAVEEAIELALQGANVLIWSMEMSWYEVFVRLYISLSGRKGVTTTFLDGVNMDAGFDANDVRSGKLSETFEAEFRDFLANINDSLPGNIHVKGVDDNNFRERKLRNLSADILHTNADVVIIDPFYYLDYEPNVSKTSGGDAAETSRKLRALTGTQQVVTIAITQADEGKESKDEDGARELVLPDRENVKKTKSLLEDATMLIAIDTDYKQGRGLIGINKGRNGGEGDVIEILYIPQYGIVKPLLDDNMNVSQFDF